MPDKTPNILILFTDDQRFDTIQAINNPMIITPNLHRLAERSVYFDNAYIMGGTSGAVCMPSRAMLMTGRGLFRIQDEGQDIAQDQVMLGEALRREGYRTCGIGKWHNGRSSYARSFTAGARIMFGGMSDHWNVPAYDFDPAGKYDSKLPYCVDPFYSNEIEYRNADHIVAGKHSSDLFADAAVDFLKERQSSDPFMLYIAFQAPHDPRTMPKKYLDMYNYETIPLPPNYMPEHPFDNGAMTTRDEKLENWPRRKEAVRRHIHEYYAMITHLDDAIGRVLDALDESGEADNTIIVLAGDNGLAVGRHGLMGKQSLYEHSIRVPLMISAPGAPRGKRSEAFCYLSDIYRTLCDLIGIDAPASVEGSSLVPAMAGDDKIRDVMYFAYTHLMRGARDSRFKLIEYVNEGKRRTQLFDLAEDPHELNNLADHSAHVETLARLRKELLRLREEHCDTRDKHEVFWRGFAG